MLRDPAAHRVAHGHSLGRQGCIIALMPERRFPPPWTVEEYRGISYIVRDANNLTVAYVYFDRSRVDVQQQIS
jgi:hypothetical protein